MAREFDLINHVPDVYSKIEEIQEIMKVETTYINSLWVNTENVYKDAFIITSTDYGLDRRYKFLDMPIIQGEDRDTRIFKLLARYQEQAPYTWLSLKVILDSLVGEGNYLATRNVATKNITVRVQLTKASQMKAIEDLLERITPQNMTINVILLYNTWDMVSNETWNDVSNKTWNEIREDVI